MNGDYASFLSLHAQDSRDLYEVAARRLNTVLGYIEKENTIPRLHSYRIETLD